MTIFLFQAFGYKEAFPDLVHFEAKYLCDQLAVLNNMTEVTKVSRWIVRKNPFDILSQLPNIQDLELKCYRCDFNGQPFEHQSLTRLKINLGRNLLSFAELKAVFSFFPNLVEVSLEIGGLQNDFNEEVT
jgi:hypothetical protein